MTKEVVSVVIPTYNNRMEVERCIGSVRSQTYLELEILCVDDGSSDGTYEMIQRISAEDARVKAFHMEENCGPLAARKRGVEEAVGSYLLFLDADDEIEVSLIEELMREEEKEKADILHFSTKVVNCGVRDSYCEGTRRFTAPYLGKLSGSEIAEIFFGEDPRGWHLWGKLYRTRLCKEIFRTIEGNYRNAEDLLVFYFLALAAESYRGLETENAYLYYLGEGLMGTGEIDMKEFRIFCQAADVYSAMERYSRNFPFWRQQQERLLHIKRRLVFDNVWVFWNRLKLSCREEGFAMLLQVWDRVILKEALKELQYGDYFRKKIHSAAQIAKKEDLQILLYPYGKMGKQVERELREIHGIHVKKADQKAGEGQQEVLSMEELEDTIKEHCICMICSDRREIYDEIRQIASGCFPGKQIYDLFPQSEQKYSLGETL